MSELGLHAESFRVRPRSVPCKLQEEARLAVRPRWGKRTLHDMGEDHSHHRLGEPVLD